MSWALELSASLLTPLPPLAEKSSPPPPIWVEDGEKCKCSAETATAASPSFSVPRPNVTTASVSPAPPRDGEAKDFG